MNGCSIEGCDSEVLARGLCNKHYKHLRLSGDFSTADKIMKQSKLYKRVSTAGLAKDPTVLDHPPAIRQLWRTHIQGCLRFDRVNSITIDQFVKLIQSSCYYCGIPPVNLTKTINVAHNGIDRIDSSLPYQMDNVVPCCKLCNGMKSNLSVENFYQHITSIYSYRKSRIVDTLKIDFNTLTVHLYKKEGNNE